MEDYKPNSNKYKEEHLNNQHEKVQKVVTGNVKIKKKGAFRRFVDNFFYDDMNKVKTFTINDVLMPTLKKAIFDIITNGTDILLYGESRGGSRRSTADRVSYRSYSDYGRRERPTESYTKRYSYDDIVLSTRGEAEDVLSRMDELIDSYGLVSVADLFDLVGMTGNFTDNKYGWTDIRNAEVVRVRDGYVIKMPRAMPID